MSAPPGDADPGLPALALTGATGFVGRRVLDLARARGFRVRALARPRPGRTLEPGAGLDWVEGGLHDGPALDRLVRGADVVIHIAGSTRAPTREAFYRDNAVASARLASAARKAGARHFIFVSSLAARRPELSAYAQSKAAGEEGVRVQAGAMAVSIVRPPAVIGPDDTATAPLIASLARGLCPAPAESGGARRFSLIDVDDLAGLIVDLAARPGRQGLIEPCGIAGTSWRALADCAGELTGRRVRLVRLPAGLLHAAGLGADLAARLSGRSFHFSRGKVREMLYPDWTCETELPGAATLRETLERCLQSRTGQAGAQAADSTRS